MDAKRRFESSQGPNKRPFGGPTPVAPEFLSQEDDEMEEMFLDQSMAQIVDLQAPAVKDVSRWQRPPAPQLNLSTDKITFMQIDIDNIAGDAHPRLTPNTPGPVPIIRVFGVTKAGNSVCAHVHGFEPYFWIPAPAGFSPDDCNAFRQILNGAVGERATAKARTPVYIRRVEIHKKMSLLHYQPDGEQPFLKIVTQLPSHVATARGIVEKGIEVPGRGQQTFQTYESGVLYPLRFMVDCDIVGGNWVEAPAGCYQMHSPKTSHCQYEIDIRWDKLVSHPTEGDYQGMGKLRILSFDIECAGRKGHFPEPELSGHFPEPEQDSVIQIASMVTVQGDKSPVIKNVMTLGTCAPIVGAEVLSFDDERDLLKHWSALVRESDPDLIIGYNIMNFDLWYLLQRAEALKVPEFPFFGRMKTCPVRMRDATFSSKAYGTRESKEFTIEGRVPFDLLQAIQRDHKLSSYSLNAVSAHFLGEQKEDVHHSAISELQAGDEQTRRRLAVYCLKDAYLPQRLLDKLLIIYNYIEMARVTGVPLQYLLARGQSIKVYSQLLRKARVKNLLAPHLPGGGSSQGDGVAYEGATVLDAKAGYYDKPIATLDFASLYPSIMMAHNLCYSTLVPPAMAKALDPAHYTKSPTGDVFMKAEKVKGILPEILEELLSARKRAKADMKKTDDPMLKAVLDGRQLALKVSANSVYGFTGATVGKLPCLEISASTTSFGRTMIEQTRNLVQEHYTVANGYENNAEVIYGDTDSVMVNFHCTELSESMRLGAEAAEVITKTFIQPIKLEFEKVYWPYLLISKKRYAGVIWTNPDKYDKIDTKGIETVRRDNCLLVKTLITTCLDKILIERNVQSAVEYVKSTIADLLMNRIDLSLLVVTKGLTQEAENYANKSAHAELAIKMRKRDPVTAPSVGDRIPYVIVKAVKGAKGYEKSEDPIYALEHNIPIDCHHYLEHYLTQPLIRIFEPIMKDVNTLFSGEHTRSISNPTPSADSGIMRFAKVQEKCKGCKTPLKKGEKTLCEHCQGNETDFFLESLSLVNQLEKQHNQLWTQCQRCQGSLTQDVLCTSRDCPIFYRRKKVYKDLSEAQKELKRFDW
ncbi:DNA polymerase delta catalytic subunit, variant 2 [Cymbomonas tetramitiformis]|uniref:DNA polymerase n=1 Tax=Cymbomonas tetramitiformis TaxID=36881 RepID=A0AAE0EUZ2_9CHLO|nr:DNA polymerase delta catalytic subunit, variant 2 [Cymbomonas tetramitiformis]